MGIVNVTPDSFYPESRTLAREMAIARGRDLFEAGCDVVDVGGESSRPGAVPVEAEDETRRVLDVVAALARYGPVSIDTQKASVARAAIAVGATVLNDVSATLADVAAELGVGYVAMHRQGDSSVMQKNPQYGDVVREVSDYLRHVAQHCVTLGISPLWLDPGIGFGKTTAHNLVLLANVEDLVALAREFGAGVVISTSRKRFLGELGGGLDVDERLEGSIATEAWAMLQGVSMVRVHDAAAAVQLRELLVRRVEEVVA